MRGNEAKARQHHCYNPVPHHLGKMYTTLAWFPVLASSPQHLYWLGLPSHQGNLVSLMLFSKEMQFKNSQPPNSNFVVDQGTHQTTLMTGTESVSLLNSPNVVL